MTTYNSKLMNLIGKLKWFNVITWAENSNEPEYFEREEITDDINRANVVASTYKQPSIFGPTHALLLDIDREAYLVESSTPGHYHLYIPASISDNLYWELIDVLARAGIIEQGYAEASKARGYTSLRFPWVLKEQ